MAVDQDLLDDIATSVADLYRSVETALVTTVANRLKQDLPLPSPYQDAKQDSIVKLRRAAEAVLQRLQKTKSAAVREAIRTAYRNGHGDALTTLPVAKQVRTDARQALEQVPGTATIENLAQALHRDLGRVEANILRDVVDGYRAVQASTAARLLTGTETRLQASQAAWQKLMNKGLTSFRDKAGRNWKLSSYVEMMTRSVAQRAAIQGQTDRLTAIGVDLVIVSDHTQECKLCRPYEGKVLSLDGSKGKVEVEHGTRDDEMVTVTVVDTLDGARSHGFQHPNCRHSVSAYLPGVTKAPTNTEDPRGDEARQRQRALERKIRAAKEQAEGALTPEAKRAANRKIAARQKALREHLKANPKLKRLPYREQIGAGNIPKGGSAPGGPAADHGPTSTPPRTPAPASPAAERVRQAAAEQDRKEAAEKARQAAIAKAKQEAIEAARRAEEARRRTPGMREALRHGSNQAGIDWANKRMPLPRFTKDELDAVKAYTGHLYKAINKGLRGVATSLTDQVKKIINGLSNAFRKAKTPEAVIVHRGVGPDFLATLGAKTNDPASMQGLVGKTFTEQGYLSTSVGRRAAFPKNIYLGIRVPEGHPAINVMPVSHFGDSEREILIDRNSRMVVHAVYERPINHGTDRAWFMEVEIVPPGWEPPPGWTPDPRGDLDQGYQAF